MTTPAAISERTDAERLAEAYELRFRGNHGKPLSKALFGAYVCGIVGMVYGSVLTHYVFTKWPTMTDWVTQHSWATIGLLVLLLLILVGVAYRVGARRGPVLPEPGFLEIVAATDLPRAMTLKTAWRSSQIVVYATTVSISIALAIGLLLANVSAAALIPGAIFGVVGGFLIVQAWLRGQARGYAAFAARHRVILESLPGGYLLRQSVLSDAITTAMMSADTRRIRSQVFDLKLGSWPKRIPTAGPHRTVVYADIVGLLRTGMPSLGWLIVEVAAVVVASLRPLVHVDSPLLIPVLLLMVHIFATGLQRGLQGQAAGSGSPSLLGLRWGAETALHVLPLALVQFVVALVTGLVSGVVPVEALERSLGLTLLVTGSAMLYAHKGPAPSGGLMSGMGGGGMMGNPGGGVAVLWAMHPAIIVIAAGFAAHLGAYDFLLASAVVLVLAAMRSRTRFSPARVKLGFMEMAQQEQDRKKAARG